MATPLADVGLQVWSAALLLSDWLLHVEKDIAGQHVLELGAGTGLVSCLAACLGANVYCTETGEAVLANCQHNAERNATAFRGHVWVRELDWREVDHPLLKRQQLAGKRPKRSKSKFAWEPADIDSALDNIQTILAADGESRLDILHLSQRAWYFSANSFSIRHYLVIYDEDINTALVTVLRRLLSNMRHEARCVLALEKRLVDFYCFCPWREGVRQYQECKHPPRFLRRRCHRLCFTIAEMDVTARAYTHFEAICFKHPDFEARRLPLDFPGFLLPHRTPQMVRGGQEQKKHQV